MSEGRTQRPVLLLLLSFCHDSSFAFVASQLALALALVCYFVVTSPTKSCTFLYRVFRLRQRRRALFFFVGCFLRIPRGCIRLAMLPPLLKGFGSQLDSIISTSQLLVVLLSLPMTWQINSSSRGRHLRGVEEELIC